MNAAARFRRSQNKQNILKILATGKDFVYNTKVRPETEAAYYTKMEDHLDGT